MEEEPILKSTTFWRGDKCLREIPEVARVNQIIYGMKLAIWFLRKKEVERQRGKEKHPAAPASQLSPAVSARHISQAILDIPSLTWNMEPPSD